MHCTKNEKRNLDSEKSINLCILLQQLVIDERQQRRVSCGSHAGIVKRQTQSRRHRSRLHEICTGHMRNILKKVMFFQSLSIVLQTQIPLLISAVSRSKPKNQKGRGEKKHQDPINLETLIGIQNLKLFRKNLGFSGYRSYNTTRAGENRDIQG